MRHAGLALAVRIERAEMAVARAAAEAWARRRNRPAEGGPAAGGYMAYCGAGSPLSHVVGTGMNGLVTAVDVARIEAFYRARGAPAALEIPAFADASLFEALPLEGYRLAEICNVLARPVGAGEAPAAPAAVREAAPDELESWARALARGFFAREPVSEEEVEIGRVMGSAGGGVCLLAESGGEIAGSAALAFHHGLALLYADSTAPAFRGRGIHGALIAARLRRAAEAGCDFAAAAARPGSVSQRNFERHGFEVVYSRVTLRREWGTAR